MISFTVPYLTLSWDKLTRKDVVKICWLLVGIQGDLVCGIFYRQDRFHYQFQRKFDVCWGNPHCTCKIFQDENCQILGEFSCYYFTFPRRCLKLHACQWNYTSIHLIKITITFLYCKILFFSWKFLIFMLFCKFSIFKLVCNF